MPFSYERIKDRFYIVAKGLCECCGKDLKWDNRDRGIGAWHAHHVHPLKDDGNNDLISNMAILCVNEPENCHFNQGHGGKEQEAQPKTTWNKINKYETAKN